jgi:serine/threonine protein kinase
MPLEGQQVGRYRFIRMLGSGGMGEVYLAEDARIGQQVAIKVMRAEVSPYPDSEAARESARLFQREAMAIARLDHPHILPLFDYGEENVNGIPLTYMAMPFRPEGSLADWLRKRDHNRLLSPEEVAHIVDQAADALQHAHDRQIIHQDVKPSNFLIRSRKEDPDHPDLLLTDFGVARFATVTSSASQVIRGTPTYMAPEQWEGLPVPATDQYALATMAYELLTGRSPFQGAPGRMMYQHINTPPQPPSTLNPRISAAIDIVLLHALAKKPEARFASITVFARAFQQAAQGTAAAETAAFLRSSSSSQQTVQDSDAPPYIKSPGMPSNSDIRAVLAISQMEARNGATRTVTLPGGRQVRVSIPPGASDGQIIRIEGQTTPSYPGGTAGALILTLAVKQTYASFPLASSAEMEGTFPLSGATAPGTFVPALSSTGAPTVEDKSTSPGVKPALILNEQTHLQPASTVLPAPPLQPYTPGRDEAVPVILANASAGNALPAHHRTGSQRWLTIVLLLLVLLLISGGVAYVGPGTLITFARNLFGPPPGIASSATVTITPASKAMQNDYTITAVTGTPDTSQHQVQARELSYTTPSQSQTANATGSGQNPATKASGTLVVTCRASSSAITIAAGTVFTGNDGVQVSTDETVTASSCSTNIPAHAVQPGTHGNIAASDMNQPYEGYTINNPAAFTGGQDAQTYTVVQQSDIDGAATPLENSLTSSAQQQLQGQVHSNERLVDSPICNSNVTSDHAAGDRATTVTVSVTVTCTGEAYDYDAALSTAAQWLMQDATQSLGPDYSLVGNVTSTLTQAQLADATQGTIMISVHASGLWLFQFNDTQKQHLAQLIAGKSEQDAQAQLLQQMGVAQAGISLSNGNTLPTSSNQITIIVQSLPGTATPTT